MMLLGQSLKPILLGVALGVSGGYGLSRRLHQHVLAHRRRPTPWCSRSIAALMLAAALLAAWVPVHRVTRIDPQQALRYE